MAATKTNILIGYGNPDRGDDGASYFLLTTLLDNYGKHNSDIFSSEITELNENTDILFNFQLLPEFAELIKDYKRVIFIDTHTGEIEEDIRIKSIDPNFEHSPFTHHFSPASCLALTQSMVGKHPQGWLLSMRGYEFGFNRELTNETKALVDKALVLIQKEFLG